MKKRPEFDVQKSINPNNSVYLSKIIDPYTAKIARLFYNLGFTADLVSLISFFLGMMAIFLILWNPTYMILVIVAILLTIRNIGDTIDGKIARGSGIKSTYGGFMDIISDWLFFHPLFFIAVGYVTDNLFVGFLAVTGYMSREFARRKFEKKFGVHVTKTEEAQKVSGIKSIVTKYDLANVFWVAPIFLLLNMPVVIIYAVAIIEYTLLFGELAFDFYCFFRKEKALKAERKKEEVTNEIEKATPQKKTKKSVK